MLFGSVGAVLGLAAVFWIIAAVLVGGQKNKAT